MKLFLNIYDFFRTAVIKVLLTITEAERNVHRKKWGCLDVVILGPVQIIQRSSLREQDANACAGAESEHRVHVTDRSTRAQQRGIKDAQTNASAENISHHRLRNALDSLPASSSCCRGNAGASQSSYTTSRRAHPERDVTSVSRWHSAGADMYCTMPN